MAICRLCKQEKKLINSHFIPAAAYSHLRWDTNLGLQQSVIINQYTNSIAQTDKQVKQPLLCGACEDLFSKKGERIVGQLWATQSGFPLFEILRSKEPAATHPLFEGYSPDSIDKGHLDALVYFAVSIFWRASVWDWQRDKNPYGNGLGARYELEFANFLLSGSKLNNFCLYIELNSDEKTRRMFSFPSCVRREGSWYHSFVILGFRFVMVVGAGESKMKRVCDMFGFNPVVGISDYSSTAVFKGLSEFARIAPRRGKFGRLDLATLAAK
ncbi:hypothetical protein MBA34_19300 [Pseudomonas capeferrum]|uniref:hypothetical protein n=1 Tax=Pseudomonas capeferrum TaxID=1495066 RepID=UPI0012DEBA8B|nr:hypothetical protein [Pseudomonas capeferrum]MCH7301168.1 hypothetical protein [Pseudomonas capeferrum]